MPVPATVSFQSAQLLGRLVTWLTIPSRSGHPWTSYCTLFYGVPGAIWTLPGVSEFPGPGEAFAGTSLSILEAGNDKSVSRPPEPHRLSNQRISNRYHFHVLLVLFIYSTNEYLTAWGN